MTGIHNLSPSEQQIISYLRSPEAVRERCDQLFQMACDGQLQHFQCNLDRLDQAADYVIQTLLENYPDLDVPFHSRWRHFEIGGVPRVKHLERHIASGDRWEQCRVKFDLAIVSVLLDAGAGADWQYVEPNTGFVFRRSEGLAVASFHLFCQGVFSSDPNHSLRVDALGLQNLTLAALEKGFQVSARNPLVGSEGRLSLLRQLGHTMQKHPAYFGETARPGHLVDYLRSHAENGCLSALQVLKVILDGLGEIWPGRTHLFGVNLGDVWPHPALGSDRPGDDLVPFHKLSQWLTYSLLEPLEESGLQITDLDALTGLPEYRNGGLLLDLEVLSPKHAAVTSQPHRPDSEVIVEWRALTVSVLDAIAHPIRQRLNRSQEDLPLVKILQGGTWSAGRKIAATLREGGIPPIQLESDGTVF